jgi:hypothetical protein
MNSAIRAPYDEGFVDDAPELAIPEAATTELMITNATVTATAKTLTKEDLIGRRWIRVHAHSWALKLGGPGLSKAPHEGRLKDPHSLFVLLNLG